MGLCQRIICQQINEKGFIVSSECAVLAANLKSTH